MKSEPWIGFLYSVQYRATGIKSLIDPRNANDFSGRLRENTALCVKLTKQR